MANNSIDDKWLIVYQGTKDNFESDANKANYNNKLVIVTGGDDTNAEPYLYVNNGTNDITIPIPKMYLKGVKIGVDGMEHGFVDDFLTFVGSNGISITFEGNAVTIGIDKDTLDKIDNKLGKTDTIPAENVGGLSDGAKGIASTNPIIANRIPYLKADAFAFLQPDDFTVEVAYDGSTWVELGSNDPNLLSMFTMKNYTEGFLFDGYSRLWSVDSKVRITIKPSPTSPRNSHIDFITVSMYCNVWEYNIKSEYYDTGLSEWIETGSTDIGPSDNIAYIKYGQYFAFNERNRWGARLTFTVLKPYKSYSRILSISGFGSLFNGTISNTDNAPYTLGTLWDWDYLKNVYFPNDIYEGGISLKNKYASITSVIQSIESADDDYITISTKASTDGSTKVIEAKTALIEGSGKGLATAEDVRGSMPTKLPNPEPLTYTVNGTKYTYNGSSAANIPQIFTPTEVGKQGQLLQSMGGGVPQWTNLSEIKEVIGFAKDLTGVLEATPEEFTYRPSAGNKSIRDEGAVIRRIKGHTTVWEQRGRCTVKNWMFEPYGNNGIRQHRQSADIEWSGWEDNAYLQYPQGDKILVEIIPLNSNYLRNVNYFSAFGSVVYINEPKIVTASGDGISMRCSPDSIGFIFIPQIHNLSRMFGAGNEPQTYEAFKAIYPDIYPYCEPTIRNVKTTAIETVGFNLFNGEYADLIGGKTYYVGGTNIGTLTFTPNGTTASEVVELGDDRMYTPISSGKLSSTGTDLCVHFHHSGVKDGECADYVKHTLELPEIANYFQYGMNGIIAMTPEGKRDVYDEINSENAIQRIDNINLGTLRWHYSGPDNSHPYGYFYADINGRKAGSANVLCAKYNGNGSGFLQDKSFFGSTESSYVYLVDSAYSDLSTLKSSLSGVLLYYELAEPIVTPILEPIQLVYDVEDFGTERAISTGNSAPFRADIVYQFNAEGRIRDNGRNIEKLENKIRSYHDDGVMVTIDREIITTKSIIGNSEFRYALPDAPQDVKDDADGTLATEFWVQQNIPTEVATAMMKESLTSPRPFDAYNPNIVYEFAGSLTELTIGMLIQLDGNYDHVWIIRFGCSSGFNLSITPTVYWKDGIAPTFGAWGICELKFHKSNLSTQGNAVYLGEWKIYR